MGFVVFFLVGRSKAVRIEKGKNNAFEYKYSERHYAPTWQVKSWGDSTLSNRSIF